MQTELRKTKAGPPSLPKRYKTTTKDIQPGNFSKWNLQERRKKLGQSLNISILATSSSPNFMHLKHYQCSTHNQLRTPKQPGWPKK